MPSIEELRARLSVFLDGMSLMVIGGGGGFLHVASDKLWADCPLRASGLSTHRQCSKVLMRLRQSMGRCVGLLECETLVRGEFWGSLGGLRGQWIGREISRVQGPGQRSAAQRTLLGRWVTKQTRLEAGYGRIQ
jgi:hypothetical protein